MTNRPFNRRSAYLSALVAGPLLLSGCGQESPQPLASIETHKRSPAELRACPEPDLESLGGEARGAMLPVAYPASAVDRPMLLARPFPLVDPEAPLPTALLPRSVVRDVRPVPDEPPATAPERSPTTAVAAPPHPANTLAPRAASDDRRPPPRAHAAFASQSTPARSASHVRPAPRQAIAPSRAGRAAADLFRPSDAMQAVNRQAEQTIRRGYHLAERGALYSARAEFVQALRTIAQALDIQSGTRTHTQALAAGLTALEEAEDFVPDGSRLEADLDMAAMIHAHRTPACKDMETEHLLPVIVLQHYYTFAQQQLALSAGGVEAASMALFGLGKTYATLAIEKSVSSAVAEPKAMVFHWAALAADPGNFLAANELAVLEARWGQYATARALLQHSLATLPHSAVWRNLAQVHQRLGEAKLADLALREADAAARREAKAQPGNAEGIVPSSDVHWLDPQTFATTARSEVDSKKPAPSGDSNSGMKATPVVAPAPPRQRTAAAWFPWFR